MVIQRVISKNRKILFAILIVISLVISLVFIIDKPDNPFEIRWSIEDDIRNPKISDINKDGDYEILGYSETEGNLICYNCSGKEIWRYPTRDDCSILIDDVIQNKSTEIVAVSYSTSPFSSTLISCLTNKGELIWEKSLDYVALTGLDVIDIDNDTLKEIVLIDTAHVIILDISGTIKYQFDSNILYRMMQVVDLDNDGLLELIHIYRDSIFCYNFMGNLKWNYTIVQTQYSLNTYFRKFLISIDIDNDGFLEILAYESSSYNKGGFVFLNSSGIPVGGFDVDYWIYLDSIIVGDIENDGDSEIIFTSEYSCIYCFNFQGNEKWNYTELQKGNSKIFELHITDLNNDNINDLLFFYNQHDQRGFYILDRNGNLVTSVKTEYESIHRYIITVFDLDSDGFKEIIYKQGSELTCLDTQKVKY